MNVVFGMSPEHACTHEEADLEIVGQLVGNFTNYFIPGTNVTRDEFQADINKLSLYILYLFIAKFVLSYLSMVKPSHSFPLFR